MTNIAKALAFAEHSLRWQYVQVLGGSLNSGSFMNRYNVETCTPIAAAAFSIVEFWWIATMAFRLRRSCAVDLPARFGWSLVCSFRVSIARPHWIVFGAVLACLANRRRCVAISDTILATAKVRIRRACPEAPPKVGEECATNRPESRSGAS